MNFTEWSKSNVAYGQKLMDSAVEGAREGESEFLKDDSLGPYLERSALRAIAPTIIGACVGLVGGYLANRRSRKETGMAWENRNLTASVASGAWKRINKTRDEHWFEKNPIDYA